MSVTLGKHGDYAIRAALDLARHWDDGLRKSRDIAISMDIPPGFVKTILADLVGQGLLTSRAGPSGGYRLVRPPADITLLDIIEPTEHYLSPNKCILRGGPCDWSAACPMHEFWGKAQKAFADSLANTTLADLAEVDSEIETGERSPATVLHLEETTRKGIRQ